MKYIIDTEVLNKEKLSLAEFGILLYYVGGGENMILSRVNECLWEKGYLIKESKDTYSFLSPKFEELQVILAEGSNKKSINKRAEDLAPKIKSLYPLGYKCMYIGGSPKKYPWRDSDRVIANRLKIFFKRYGDKYTDAQILEATQRYVQGFKDDDTYMKLLKYFIFKDDKKLDSSGDIYIDESSELVAFIENPELIGGTNNDIGEII